MAFVDDLLELFPHVLVGQPGTLDSRGTFTAVGPSVSVPCRYEMNVRSVRTASGKEVVSSVSAIVAGTPGFSPHGFRFTLDARFMPRQDVEAFAVWPEADETGFVYEEVLFP